MAADAFRPDVREDFFGSGGTGGGAAADVPVHMAVGRGSASARRRFFGVYSRADAAAVCAVFGAGVRGDDGEATAAIRSEEGTLRVKRSADGGSGGGYGVLLSVSAAA